MMLFLDVLRVRILSAQLSFLFLGRLGGDRDRAQGDGFAVGGARTATPWITQAWAEASGEKKPNPPAGMGPHHLEGVPKTLFSACHGVPKKIVAATSSEVADVFQ